MNSKFPYFTKILRFCIVFLVFGFSTQAELLAESKDQNAQPDTSSDSFWENNNLENLGRIYKNDQSESLQELWLLGRYHGQYNWTEGNGTDKDSYETRRFRIGTRAKLFDKFTFHAEAISGSDFNPGYNGFTELWTQWAFDPRFVLTIGQQKNRFTHDRSTSSRYLNYLERSMLTNMFAAEYTPAVTLQGVADKLSYFTGLFSNATGTNIGEALTEYDSGHSYIAAAYYDVSKDFNTDSAFIYASYLNSDANENATNLNHFNNGFSTALILTEKAYSLVNEITAGQGADAGNAYGINFQPGWFITNKLQLVGRYQFAFSNEEQGLSPQRRYERTIDLPSGDHYNAIYAGLNYYIAKHRLKLMHGIEYSHLGGEDCWTFSSMIRLYFGPHSSGPFPANRVLEGSFSESE